MKPDLQLDPHEARALGVLIEKELSTPDQYPLTLNAATNGSNQKNNRDPVLELSEREVEAALRKMIVKGLTTSGQFFVCPVYNELILAGKTITTHHLPDGVMHSLGTPEDMDLFLKEFGATHKTGLKKK